MVLNATLLQSSMCLLPPALPTSAPFTVAPRRLADSVLQCVGMTLRARLFAGVVSAHPPAVAILCVCHGFKVRRIYARRIAAQMIQVQPFRDDSDDRLVRDTMRQSNRTSQTEVPVAALRLSACPLPAFIRAGQRNACPKDLISASVHAVTLPTMPRYSRISSMWCSASASARCGLPSSAGGTSNPARGRKRRMTPTSIGQYVRRRSVAGMC